MQTVQLDIERSGRRQWRGSAARQLLLLEDSTGVANELCGQLIGDEVTCLDCDLKAEQGLSLLAAAGLTSAPVVDDNGVLVGVVFLSRLAQLRDTDAEVEDAMVTRPVSTSQRATVMEVARLMAKHDLDHVPVVTGDGHLIGEVSAQDVVRWLAERSP
jgi:Mg/Co/Ni transporter MgtE